jgi:hypothetical protein
LSASSRQFLSLAITTVSSLYFGGAQIFWCILNEDQFIKINFLIPELIDNCLQSSIQRLNLDKYLFLLSEQLAELVVKELLELANDILEQNDLLLGLLLSGDVKLWD